MNALTNTMSAVGAATTDMVDVIDLARLPADRGVAAVVGAHYVALFRIDEEVLAIDHVDPFTDVPVLARGLVASAGSRLVVVSPLHKQRFDLRTGECVDDPAIAVRSWPTLIDDGRVWIRPGMASCANWTYGGNTTET